MVCHSTRRPSNCVSLVRAAEAMAVRRGQPPEVRRFFLYLGVSGLAFVMLYPLLWMFSASLTPGGLIGSAGLVPPRGVSLENYQEGWNGIAGVGFGRVFLNSRLG